MEARAGVGNGVKEAGAGTISTGARESDHIRRCAFGKGMWRGVLGAARISDASLGGVEAGDPGMMYTVRLSTISFHKSHFPPLYDSS